ncbi:MAG: HD-GYP domain-containing protein [Gammaproteobacteria bacterium]
MKDPPKASPITSVEVHAISTADLEMGMYVSRLDRPWTETPFLFQGFHIEEQQVIEQLQKYCKVVYVDVTRTDTSLRQPGGPEPAGSRPPLPAAQTRPRPAVKQPQTAPASRAEHEHSDAVVLSAELVKAREAHEGVQRVVEDLYKGVQAGKAVDLATIQRTIDPMIESIMRNEDAMSWLARMKQKDNYIYSHSIASAVWALVFGKHLGLDAIALHVLATGTIFMDVGKTKMPTELLTKRDKLTAEERELMKKHVEHSTEIVTKIPGIDARVIEMVRYHHERHNGTGYPKGLAGGDIPIFARIAGVIDTYDAMTTVRPYAPARSPYDAARQLSKLAGVEFPAEVVEQFIQAIGVFPVGTLVELNNGEVGMVIAQNRVRRLRPKILVLLDRDKQPLDVFPTIDLRNQLAENGGQQSLWIERGLAPGAYGLDPTEYYLHSS